jgi:hypothetical protein
MISNLSPTHNSLPTISRTLEQLVFPLSHHTPMAINRNLTSRINHYLLKLNGTLNQIPDIIDISCLRAKSN